MTIKEVPKRDKRIQDLFDEALSIEGQARSLESNCFWIDWREVKPLEDHALSMRNHHDRRHRRLTGWWHRNQAELHAKQVQHYIDRFHQQRGAQMAA